MGVKVWGWAVPVGAPRGEVNVRAMYGSGGKVARWRGKRNVCILITIARWLSLEL